MVEQTRWKYISLVSRSAIAFCSCAQRLCLSRSSEDGCLLYLRADPEPFPLSRQKEDRLCRPDFALIRNFPTNLHQPDGFRNIILGEHCEQRQARTFSVAGMMFASLPSVNSLQSLYLDSQRILQGACIKLAHLQGLYGSQCLRW